MNIKFKATTFLSVFILITLLIGCGNSKKTESAQEETVEQQQPSAKPAVVEKEEPIRVGEVYKAYYDANSVTLEEISYGEKMDQETALKLLVNSCDEVKADFLNYMMDVYQTIEPSENELEPMFDAEHIGKFIVWQIANEEVDCFPQIFAALEKVFKNGDADAIFLARYGVYQMMIYESKKVDVNYNGDFNPWLTGVTYDQWFTLIDEMESGRS